MNTEEKRAIFALALLFASRMLGLFMVLPVLSLYAVDYEFSNAALIGLAIGIYGLSQALLQIPFGYLSDRFGRKPLILIGLVLFFFGSVLAANANTIYELIFARCLQGCGAIASVIMALLSDLTRPENRTKAMASVGVSIGLSFAVALIIGPAVVASWSLPALFYLTAGLAVMGMLLLFFLVPAEPEKIIAGPALPTFRQAAVVGFGASSLRILNFSVFVLHVVMTASFLVFPRLLSEQWGLSVDQHWWVYLAVFAGSLLVMIPGIVIAERQKKTPQMMMASAVLLLVGLMILSGLLAFAQGAFLLGGLALLLFFSAFNLMEAMLPSELSKQATLETRGAAMGAFSSSQFAGAFVGGWLGGMILERYDAATLFAGAALLVLVWLFYLMRYRLVAL